MAATHEYLCVVRLHVPIDYQNVSIVNFAWGQKVVPAGWLPAAERLELRHAILSIYLSLKADAPWIFAILELANLNTK